MTNSTVRDRSEIKSSAVGSRIHDGEHADFDPQQCAAKEQTRLREFAKEASKELRQIVAQGRGRYLLIPLEDVCFFRMEDGLTKAKTDTALYRVDYSLTELDERLPDPPFFRAHRSTIVNLRKRDRSDVQRSLRSHHERP